MTSPAAKIYGFLRIQSNEKQDIILKLKNFVRPNVFYRIGRYSCFLFDEIWKSLKNFFAFLIFLKKVNLNVRINIVSFVVHLRKCNDVFDWILEKKKFFIILLFYFSVCQNCGRKRSNPKNDIWFDLICRFKFFHYCLIWIEKNYYYYSRSVCLWIIRHLNCEFPNWLNCLFCCLFVCVVLSFALFFNFFRFI